MRLVAFVCHFVKKQTEALSFRSVPVFITYIVLINLLKASLPSGVHL